MITLPAFVTFTKKAGFVVVGVTENVYVDPPFDVVNDDSVAFVVVTLKSLLSPSVAPAAPATLTLHTIAEFTRCGLPRAHDSTDAVVGYP